MDGIIEVRIEIPRGGRNKYEYDEAAGALRLNRVLHSSMHYPADYGYILDTHAPDGDALDALVLVEEPTIPGCLVPARPIGVLKMTDDQAQDDKVLSVPVGDPRFAEVRNLEDIGGHWLKEIANFFQTYKVLEGREVKIITWHGLDVAWETVREATAALQGRRKR
jgi:inorganic pyrophosphatase